MPARRYLIEAKTKAYPLATAAPGDFRCHDAGPVAPDIVLSERGFSLYCLDHDNRRALFVETGPLDAPFYYQAQYEGATSLVAVSYDALHELAEKVPFDPERVILVYSIGRCGSTLAVRALAELGGVRAISEPDVFTQLVMLASDGLDSDELSRLGRSCLRFVCRGETRVALKFRSFVVEIADSLHTHLPGADALFLYRDPAAWTRSSLRAFAGYDPAMEHEQARVQDRLGRLIPLLARLRAREGRLLSPVEMLACQWVSQVERALALRHRGIPLFTARYEELDLDALFAFCGLPAPTGWEHFMTKDSQEGTSLSRRSVRQRPSEQLDEAELNRVITALWSILL